MWEKQLIRKMKAIILSQNISLDKLFSLIDEDGSGTIDAAEINKVMEDLGVDRRNPLVIGIILKLKEANRPIKFEEFLEIPSQLLREKEAETAVLWMHT